MKIYPYIFLRLILFLLVALGCSEKKSAEPDTVEISREWLAKWYDAEKHSESTLMDLQKWSCFTDTVKFTTKIPCSPELPGWPCCLYRKEQICDGPCITGAIGFPCCLFKSDQRARENSWLGKMYDTDKYPDTLLLKLLNETCFTLPPNVGACRPGASGFPCCMYRRKGSSSGEQ